MTPLLVLAGTPQQFQNFRHAVGMEMREVLHLHDLDEAAAQGGRPVILLVGTWTANPLHLDVLEWARTPDRQGRPSGVCFAKFGPGR